MRLSTSQAKKLAQQRHMAQLTDGRFVAVEVKSRTGRLSEEQGAFLQCVAAGGGVAIVARSVDDVLEALRR